MDNFKTKYKFYITIENEANSQLLDVKIKSRFLRDLANIWGHTINVLDGIVSTYNNAYFQKLHDGVLIEQIESTWTINITVDPNKRTIETSSGESIPVDSPFRAILKNDVEANIPKYVFTSKFEDKHSLFIMQTAKVVFLQRCKEILEWLKNKELDWVQILAISTNYPEGNYEDIKKMMKEVSNGVPSYYVKLVYSTNADDLLKQKKSKSNFHSNVNLAWEETVKMIPKFIENYKHHDFISSINEKLNARSKKLSGKSISELIAASSEFEKEHDLYYKYIWDPKEYLITWLGDKQVSTDFRLKIGFTSQKLFSKISPFILHYPNDEYNFEIVSRDANSNYLFILKAFYSLFLKKLKIELSWLSEKNLQRDDIITITKNFSIENQTEIEDFIDHVEKSIERIGFRISLSKSWNEIKSLKPRIRKKSFLFYALFSAIQSVKEEWYDAEIEKISKSVVGDDLDKETEQIEFESNFSLFLAQSRRKSDKNEIELLWDKEIPDPFSLITKFISYVMDHIQTELETLFRERNSNWKDYILVEPINI
ncbi:MAG: hypothetical protein ACXADY_13935 [Candidatus Hodarchaeales archaeon]|jgi:hypothetical protein